MTTDVFITVDTEVWPTTSDWRETELAVAMDRDIYGVTTAGNFGLRYQLERLREFKLKAVFFVEALFATAASPKRLREIVSLVQEYGQDVQLHLHPEWNAWMESPIIAGRNSQYLKEFTSDEQRTLISVAVENLRTAGATSVVAFRAGNYGADNNTLKALEANGLLFDTSYNLPYLATQCGIKTDGPLFQPAKLNGIIEYPVTFFEDWPGHQRHLQLTACSASEMRHVLVDANRKQRRSVVLVSHSFELLKNRHDKRARLLPDSTCLHRFESLCRFLREHEDRFQTRHFADECPTDHNDAPPSKPLRSNVLRTGQRVIEQLIRRF